MDQYKDTYCIELIYPEYMKELLANKPLPSDESP
jgi:hypothetical protein